MNANNSPVKLAKARRGMIKEKAEKGGGAAAGARLKDEPSDPTEPGHGSRPPSASLPTPASLKKEPDEMAHRVKLEGARSQGPPAAPDDGAPADLAAAADIKTEIDTLIEHDGGDPTKSPPCELGGPGSLKSERLSSDSGDLLDPQTGMRNSAGNAQEGNPGCRMGGGGDMGPCRMGAMGPMGPGAQDAQQLPSNVISKQSGSMEQSQIFVFSTLLANKGAEAVLQGHHHSIIAYHCAQPGTKKYLEKHPLKMGQFNKQSPAQWLNNLAMAKSRSGMRGNPIMGPNQMGPMMGSPMGNVGPMGPMGPGMGGMGARMGGPGNMMMMKGQMGGMGPGMGPMGPGMGPMDGFPGAAASCGVMDGLGGDGEMPWDTKPPNVMSNGMANGGGGGHMASCSEPGAATSEASASTTAPSSEPDCQGGPKGVKIPDENLTPQQRAHREEQLATIRKMHQLFFPETSGSNPQSQNPDGPQNPEMNPPSSTASNMNMPFPPNMSGMGPNGPMSGPNIPNSMGTPSSCSMAGPMGPSMSNMGPMGPSGPMGGPSPIGSMGGPNPMGMGGHGPMGPNGMMSGPMMGMGPGPMGMGPCGMKGIRGPCGPDMKGGMCSDMHMGRACGGPMGRMGNPMSMGGAKACMMGGPMGPRIMHQPNINSMNGGMMMESMMGGMGPHGECGPDHHGMPMNGPMCDEYGRGRNMGPGDPGGLGPGGLGPGLGPGGMGPGNMGPGVGPHKLGLRSPKSPGADLDWQKIQHQFFDEHKPMDTDLGGGGGGGGGAGGGGGQAKSPCSERGGCLPPPPYGASPLHRSASVPIATQSPSHGGVQMPMSAEASRAGSGLNSPAGPHCKMSKGSDAPEICEKLEEGVFVRTLQCLAAQQQKSQQPQGSGGGAKEPPLMPVPSPQQIHYLNQFEGQELTIQKQPNTSLKEGGGSGAPTPGNNKSPGMMPGTPEPHGSLMEQRAGRFSMEQSPSFNNPQTPTSAPSNEKSRPSPSSQRSQEPCKTPQREPQPAMNPSPYGAGGGVGGSGVGGSGVGGAGFKCGGAAPTSAPSQQPCAKMDEPTRTQSQQESGGVTLSGGPNSTALPSPFPPGGGPLPRDNVPINPNHSAHPPLHPHHPPSSTFDPISSLAQMSQQLTNTVGGAGPPGPGPSPAMGPGPMAHFGSQPHHMQHHHGMHPQHHHAMMMSEMGCHMEGMGPGMGGPMDSMMGPGDFPPEMNMSPKMSGGPMSGPMGPMGPEGSMMGPRMPGQGKMPPFNGANVQVKASTPNTIQYLPTRPQMPCNSGPRAPPSLDFLQRVTNPMQMEAGKGVQYFPGGRGMDMDGSLRGMMRAPVMRMPHYPTGFNSPPKMGDPFGNPGPNPMCGPNFRGVKGPMGPSGVRLNTAQPLPPSMGGPNPGFKGQGFAVPSTADPNYAAQFHNFQQQLYATGSRQAQPHQPYPPYQPSK